MVLTNFTFTRTVATITSTTLTNVLNKTTGGGMLYQIQVEDLDGSAGNEDCSINLDSVGAISPNAGLIAADEILNIGTLLCGPDADAGLETYLVTRGDQLHASHAIFFDTSLNFQLATHATPTSGTRVSIVYGDPPDTWGHKQGIITEPWEYYIDLPVGSKIESAYLMAEMRNLIDPELDVIREEYSGAGRRVWFEHAELKTAIQLGMKGKLETYLKQTYKYKRDARPIDPITHEYLAPIVI